MSGRTVSTPISSILHQGTEIIPVDFITALQPHHTLPKHHAALLANCFAQSEALMVGKSAEKVRADLEAAGMSTAEIEVQTPQRMFPGNRPEQHHPDECAAP